MPITLFIAACLSVAVLAAPGVAQTNPSPGDQRITVPIGDDHAGGIYQVEFEKVYSNTTDDGTPVYLYVPVGAIGNPDVPFMDPTYDPNPNDAFKPCGEGDYNITQAQINYMGDQLTDQIVRVDEEHYGPMGQADPTDPKSDALVMLVYNALDDAYYDCAAESYTAGYFAPDFIQSQGMNVIVVDAFDWAQRTGDQSGNPDGQSELYEGVVAHELEHLLHHYSDSGELSWVDEGLADFAVFLNGYDVGGSHLTYHQVFHRETSLTRWAGGLENYGAAYTFFQYVWEQAGGNGPGAGRYEPDLEYDNRAGDLLIKRIFQNQADGMEGVQAAINQFNAETGSNLRSAEELYKDWALAVYFDREGSDRFDIRAVDFGKPEYTSWTIDIANDTFWNKRGQYGGAMPEAKWQNQRRIAGQTALPFGLSYETFRNVGQTFKVRLDGDDQTSIAPHSPPNHWYANYESMNENVLNIDGVNVAGKTVDFWTWYFIEEGWDFGYLEAQVGGVWQTVPLTNDAGQTVTTNADPHGNNTEGNGLTGTSGGAYFVDEPQYIHLKGQIPANATDARFVYETDAAYLDTGWFVDDVSVGGTPLVDGVNLTSPAGNWFRTDGTQDNNWVLQLASTCDITPGTTLEGEFREDGLFIYRFEGDDIRQSGFDTRCMRSTQQRIVAVISNMPTGDLQVLDADYIFRLTKTS
jgi:hypothetical protein